MSVLHHWTTVAGLASIAKTGEIQPHPGEPWLRDPVIWLTTADCDAFFDPETHLVCIEIDHVWADAEPFQPTILQLAKLDSDAQRRAVLDWWIALTPISFSRIAGIVVNGQRYRTAAYDGKALRLVPKGS